MTKFVCDYAQVNSIGNKLLEASNSLIESANRYNSSIDGSLSSWTGNTKTTFVSQSNAQVDKVLAKAKYISSFGEFIINSARSIQELDDDLANINI